MRALTNLTAKQRQNSRLVKHGAALPCMLKSKFLRPELTFFMKGNTMNNEQIDFLADALQSQELIMHALLKSLQQSSPHVTAAFIQNLQTSMPSAEQTSQGVHANLTALLGALRATQPKQPGVH